MLSSNWLRWSGLAGVLGGVLWALWYVGVSLVGGAGYGTYNRLMPLVLLLLAVGLLGLHAAQNGSHGGIGRAGFMVALGGLLVMTAGNVADFWVFAEEGYGPASLKHSAWMLFGLGLLAFYVGTVLFGAGTLRAGVLPRSGALLLLVWFPLGFVASGLLQFAGVPEALAFSGMTGLCGLGWAILGHALLSGGEAARQPARVR